MRATLYCVMLLYSTLAVAYNQAPSVENVRINNDKHTRHLLIYFDLRDTKNDSLTVTFKVYDNRDRVLVNQVFQEVSGLDKLISWPYVSSECYRISITVSREGDIACLLDAVDTARLKQSLISVYGDRNRFTDSVHLEKVRSMIASTFKECQVETSIQEVKYGIYTGYNIIGHIPGKGKDQKRILITAHYDTVEYSPGADDNGSGIAGMLEALRILSGKNFNSAIDFIAFDLEEVGAEGSRQYVAALDSASYSVDAVINLDMIGLYSDEPNSQLLPEAIFTWFPDAARQVASDSSQADFVLSISDQNSMPLAQLFNEQARRYVPELEVVTLATSEASLEAMPDLAASDHLTFWSDGYKAIHVGEGGITRNKHYHSAEDKIEAINYAFMAKVVKATIATVVKQAEMQDVFQFNKEVCL